MKNVDQIIEQIHKLPKFNNLDDNEKLNNISFFLELENNPQDQLKTIHVAGTNGKGSTVNYLSDILQAANKKVGTFTSPFIIKFNDRFMVNGQAISDVDLVRLASDIFEKVQLIQMSNPNFALSEFEFITILGFKYFLEQNVDYAIIEAGIGGRFDSTNVIKQPQLSVITSIAADHLDLLGPDLTDVAWQKAGIIKKRSQTIIPKFPQPIHKIFKDIAKDKKNKLSVIEKVSVNEMFGDKQFELTNFGQFQQMNAALAIKSAKTLLPYLSDETIQLGLNNFDLPGRAEFISSGNNLILLDGAHNPEGIKALVDSVNAKREKFNKIKIFFAALKRKDTKSMLNELQNISNAKIFLTTFDFGGASDNKTFEGEFDYLPDWHNYTKHVDEDDLVIFLGSLYFISEVRRNFKK